ncbi:MAG: hypothetical protein AAB692_05500 [Patescibacteria group bacterium]
MAKINTEALSKFFARRGIDKSLGDRAVYVLADLFRSMEIGATVPFAGDVKAARDRNEAKNRRLWQQCGGDELRLELGDAMGYELRDALTAVIGVEFIETFDDSLFMFLGFAAAGDEKGMNRMMPHVMALARANHAVSPSSQAA